MKGLNRIVATIGLAITTSVATFTTISAKNKENDSELDSKEMKSKDKKKDKKDKKDKEDKKDKKKKDKYININKEKSKYCGLDESQSKRIIDSCITQLSQWRAVNGIPGLVIGVSLRGHAVWVYSEGFADIENAVKCSDNTVMRIASISKSITALLLGKLIDEKKIDIDLPIDKYLTKDQFPDKYWDGKKVDITVRQLASHLGGIRHYKKDNETHEQNTKDITKDIITEDNKINKAKDAVNYQLGEFSNKEYYLKHTFESVTESLKLFKDDPLVANPGTKYVYTTFGWTLISAVIETQLNSQPFEKYLIKFLREQLGMNYTVLDQNDPIIYNRSKYYVKSSTDGKLINTPYVDNSYKWAGGGLLSNVYDLLKFGNIMLYSHKGGTNDGKRGFLSKETIDMMWTAAPNTRQDWDLSWGGYGIGWCAIRDAKSQYAFCSEPAFANLFSHTGGAVGASSVILIEPNHELVITIITNLQNAGGIYKMALDIAKQFTKEEFTYQRLDQLLKQNKFNSITDNQNKL